MWHLKKGKDICFFSILFFPHPNSSTGWENRVLLFSRARQLFKVTLHCRRMKKSNSGDTFFTLSISHSGTWIVFIFFARPFLIWIFLIQLFTQISFFSCEFVGNTFMTLQHIFTNGKFKLIYDLNTVKPIVKVEYNKGRNQKNTLFKTANPV